MGDFVHQEPFRSHQKLSAAEKAAKKAAKEAAGTSSGKRGRSSSPEFEQEDMEVNSD